MLKMMMMTMMEYTDCVWVRMRWLLLLLGLLFVTGPQVSAWGDVDSDGDGISDAEDDDDDNDGLLDNEDDDDDGGEGESNYGSESMLSPNNSGMSPIDMESQEKIKLERKRLRNRLAASKCRKRKLERISQLDERVAQLKTENSDLAAVVKKMKSSVAVLKQEVMEHVNSGCEIRMTDANAFS